MSLVMDDLRPQRRQGSSAWVDDGVLKIRPTGQSVPAFLLQANQAVLSGQLGQAMEYMTAANEKLLEQCLSQDPSRMDLLYMMARLWIALGRHAEAEPWCRRIVDQEGSALAMWQMAELLGQGVTHQGEALRFAQLAVEREPDNRVFQRCLARCLCEAGFLEQGIASMKRFHEEDPDDVGILSEWLWFQQYSPQSSRQSLFQGYRRWGQIVGRTVPIPTPLRNTPDPERSLRIGFLSPDFRQNVAASALELVIDGLDRGAGQVFGYANVAHPDAVTSRLQGKLDGYRNVWGWSSGLIADCIRADQIDILVVVGGHVAHHCLEVCLHRAAPVQVDFHGLCTTGLEQVDYRFTDELLDPPEQLGFYLERSVYLPGGWFCLRPPEVSPLVSPLPALTQGHVTFGSFNSYVKITDSVLDAWAAILTALPDSRLILKFHSGDDPILRQIFMDKFGTRGIREDRVEICGRRPYLAHLDLFHRVDLALDTYPFNGGMTTLEALWMGVPVLTLTGSTFLSRAGLSILSRLGLEAFSCRTQQEYVAKAVAISGQTDALAEIRRSLRGRLLASPLCHPRRIGSELEAAFRWMWRNWCDRRLAKR